MASVSCSKDLLPFTAMVMVECTTVGINVLFKAASSMGLSFLVFVVYSYLVAALLLFPFIFYFNRRVDLPPNRLSLLFKIVLLGLAGLSAQLCGYKGIAYSSPTLASAMSNLTPAFTFVLAVIFRMEKLDWRCRTTKAKIRGTVLSIAGACVVTLYKGPVISILSQGAPTIHDPVLPHHPQASLNSSASNWIIGGLLLATEYLLLPIWYIVQTQIMKEYPAELVVVFLYNLCGAILSLPVGLILERDLNAWKLQYGVKFGAIIYSGFFGSSTGTLIHTWGLRIKGPVYVAMFRPLSIAIAAIMSAVFLGETLHLGSVIGAVVISIGFYSVLGAKAREEVGQQLKQNAVHSFGERMPLCSNSEL